jgi:hypothetical protein
MMKTLQINHKLTRFASSYNQLDVTDSVALIFVDLIPDNAPWFICIARLLDALWWTNALL